MKTYKLRIRPYNFGANLEQTISTQIENNIHYQINNSPNNNSTQTPLHCILSTPAWARYHDNSFGIEQHDTMRVLCVDTARHCHTIDAISSHDPLVYFTLKIQGYTNEPQITISHNEHNFLPTIREIPRKQHLLLTLPLKERLFPTKEYANYNCKNVSSN